MTRKSILSPSNAQEWYSELNQRKKLDYKKSIMDECGISESSFYNYLKNKPQKLIAEKMAQLANRPIHKMWANKQ